MAAWHFLSLPKNLTNGIKVVTAENKKSFGSVRVEVKIADYSWKTSLFPDTKEGTYLLPLKKEARQHTGVAEGDMVTAELALLDI